jgi:branched-chain amino acid transport system permease protein
MTVHAEQSGQSRKRIPSVVYAVCVIAVLLAVNAALDRCLSLGLAFYNGYYEDILLRAGIFVILAVSLNLVNGFTGQFSLGHAGLFGLGAYAGAMMSTYAQATFLSRLAPAGATLTWLSGGVLMLLSMLAGGLVAAAAGWLVGLPSLKLRGDYLAIVTLGFNQIIVVILNSTDAVGGTRGFDALSYHGQSISIPSIASFFWVYLIAAAVIALSLNLRNSVQGLAFLSIREDEVAAEAMGVPTTRVKVTAFVVAAFFAGVAGALFATEQGYIKPDNFNFVTSITPVMIVVMVVLGGMGSVTGTAISAVLLIVVPECLHAIDQYRLVIYSLLLIMLMLLRPQGIFGHEELGMSWLGNQWSALRALPTRLAGRENRRGA